MDISRIKLKKNLFKSKSLYNFEKIFDPTRENTALQARGEFINTFPINQLKNLALRDYVIGLNKSTFCYWIEPKTKAWAFIQGGTAFKFGIYFGRTKSEPQKKYRYSAKFGSSKTQTFKAVKVALIELIAQGRKKKVNFAAIDTNPLSQMFKAKILSLYFPNKFLNVCSKEHLKIFANILGYTDTEHASEIQHLLINAKMANPITKIWSNPKFMEYLYAEYLPKHSSAGPAVRKLSNKRPNKVNFEDIQKNRSEIGKKSEAYALKWEKDRLNGADLTDLVKKIDDRRDRPRYGYDFLSFSERGVERYIEVKTIAKVKPSGHRCFVSENELTVSKSTDHSTEYFFYLVSIGKDGIPINVTAVRANELYEASKLVPVAHEMYFELNYI